MTLNATNYITVDYIYETIIYRSTPHVVPTTLSHLSLTKAETHVHVFPKVASIFQNNPNAIFSTCVSGFAPVLRLPTPPPGVSRQVTINKKNGKNSFRTIIHSQLHTTEVASPSEIPQADLKHPLHHASSSGSSLSPYSEGAQQLIPRFAAYGHLVSLASCTWNHEICSATQCHTTFLAKQGQNQWGKFGPLPISLRERRTGLNLLQHCQSSYLFLPLAAPITVYRDPWPQPPHPPTPQGMAQRLVRGNSWGTPLVRLGLQLTPRAVTWANRSTNIVSIHITVSNSIIERSDFQRKPDVPLLGRSLNRIHL